MLTFFVFKGTTYGGQWDSWYGPDGRKDQPYNFEILYNSPTSKSLKKIGMELPIKSKVTQLRKDSQLECVKNKGKKFLCHPLQQICLFNITADPCEYNNLSFKVGKHTSKIYYLHSKKYM